MSWMCQCPRDLPDTMLVCTVCQSDRPTTILGSKCDECSTPTRQVQLTPGEDGTDRCASCHIAYLRRRMQRDPISPEALKRCRALLAIAFANAEAKWKSTRTPETFTL